MAEDGAMHSLLAAVAVAARNTAPPRVRPHPTSSSSPPPVASPDVHSHDAPSTSPKSSVSLPTAPPLPLPQQIQLTVSPRSTTSIAQPINLPPPPPLPPPLPSSPIIPQIPPPPPPELPCTATSPSYEITPVPSRSPLTADALKTPAATPSQRSQFRSTPAPSERPKKGARIFTATDKTVLETNYSKNKFPTRVHMITLARALGKTPEKVRTWYNNRRALDRKLGLDVARNTPVTPRDSSVERQSHSNHQPDNTDGDATTAKSVDSQHADDDVILPSNLLTSPFAEFATTTTPRTIARIASPWPPSASPVTGGGLDASPTPFTSLSPGTGVTHSASRVRIAPLRIRHVRLMIGTTTIYGEIPHDPPLDQGLEVKFLFGKKRIVYEWYVGPNYSQSQDTGGPYAKLEMGFASVTRFSVIQGPSTTVLRIRLAQDPSMFLQTEESMSKFKQRAQQRQYRRVAPDQFPIVVTGMSHAITLQTDEAMRICNILLEDYPRLLDVCDMSFDDKFAKARTAPAPTPRLRELGPLLMRERFTPIARHVELSADRTSGHTARFASLDIGRTSERLMRQSAARATSPLCSSIVRNEHDKDSSTGLGVVSEKPTNTTDVVEVPSTPVNALRSNGSERTCEREPTTVRRELNFEQHGHTVSPARSTGSKRRSTGLHDEDEDEENYRRGRVRRRLSPDDDDRASVADAAPDGSADERTVALSMPVTAAAEAAETRSIDSDRAAPLDSIRNAKKDDKDADVSTCKEKQSDTSKAEVNRERPGYGVIRLLPR